MDQAQPRTPRAGPTVPNRLMRGPHCIRAHLGNAFSAGRGVAHVPCPERPFPATLPHRAPLACARHGPAARTQGTTSREASQGGGRPDGRARPPPRRPPGRPSVGYPSALAQARAPGASHRLFPAVSPGGARTDLDGQWAPAGGPVGGHAGFCGSTHAWPSGLGSGRRAAQDRVLGTTPERPWGAAPFPIWLAIHRPDAGRRARVGAHPVGATAAGRGWLLLRFGGDDGDPGERVRAICRGAGRDCSRSGGGSRVRRSGGRGGRAAAAPPAARR